jgi:hypothetical protein
MAQSRSFFPKADNEALSERTDFCHQFDGLQGALVNWQRTGKRTAEMKKS